MFDWLKRECLKFRLRIAICRTLLTAEKYKRKRNIYFAYDAYFLAVVGYLKLGKKEKAIKLMEKIKDVNYRPEREGMSLMMTVANLTYDVNKLYTLLKEAKLETKTGEVIDFSKESKGIITVKFPDGSEGVYPSSQVRDILKKYGG